MRQPEEPSMGIRIYPNPAHGVFQIESPIAIEKVTMFDASGKMVLEKIEKATHLSIQLPVNIAGGLYFVQMQTEEGAVVSKKVLVRRVGE